MDAGKILDDFRSGKFDCKFVKIRGTIRDAFDDEVDGHFTYLVLNCDGRLLYAPLHTPTQEFKVGDGMIGAEVEIDGICDPMPLGGRRYMGYTLLVQNADAIKILKASDEDAFDVPAIDETQNIGPMEIQALGKRRARGTILATWRPNNIMLETARRKLIFATIANQTLPAAGTSVEVVGLPETSLRPICSASPSPVRHGVHRKTRRPRKRSQWIWTSASCSGSQTRIAA